MQLIKNSFNDSYQIELTAGKVRKSLLAEFGVDLLEPDRDGGKLLDIVRSTPRMMDLIWFLVKERNPSLNEDDFWDKFRPDMLAEAIQKMRAEIDFFIQTVQPQSKFLLQSQKAGMLEELERQKVVEFLESGEIENALANEMSLRIDEATEQLKQTLRSQSSSTSLQGSLVPTSIE